MPKITEEAADQRKREIIDAARELYRERSFKEITIKDIGEHVSFARTNIYNYFETKEEIFLTLLKSSYDDWAQEMEKLRESYESLSVKEFCRLFSLTLEKQMEMLKLLSTNLYDIEENCRLSFLVDMKKSYKKALDGVSELLKKFFPAFEAEDRNNFIYSLFPFIYGVYPYTMMTEKQMEAMREAGIEIYKIPIKDFVYKTMIILLGGDNE